MSTPLDVLVVLDRAIARNLGHGAAKGSYSDKELVEARNASSDLIMSSQDAAAILQSKAGQLEQETPRRLYAAIARATGEKS